MPTCNWSASKLHRNACQVTSRLLTVLCLLLHILHGCLTLAAALVTGAISNNISKVLRTRDLPFVLASVSQMVRHSAMSVCATLTPYQALPLQCHVQQYSLQRVLFVDVWCICTASS